MSAPGTRVLVVADRSDDEASLVERALRSRDIEPVWVDTADFPERLGLAFTTGGRDGTHAVLTLPDGRCLSLTDVDAIYRRSPAVFELDSGMSAPERRFAMMEAVQGVGGTFAALDCRWMNHPSRVADASYKPSQLTTAAACGFAVPRTIVTTLPDRLRSFVETVPGSVVYKPMSPGVVAEQGAVKVVNATIVDSAIGDLQGLGRTAHMCQEFIHKKYDARVNVVGDDTFAVVIETDDDAAFVDWRADYDALAYRAVGVPDGIRAAIASYMARTGLLYAAFDFSVDRAGVWWFLEANPNGRWAWIQEETGQPIAEAVAWFLAPARRAAG